jgi:hypothetical protein
MCNGWNWSNTWGFANESSLSPMVQDKVVLLGERTFEEITVLQITSEQIYFSNTRIDATGYFKIRSLTDPAIVVTLTFLYQNTPLVIPAGIDPLGNLEAVAFTVVGFDEITISTNLPGTVSFELSLTPRYIP